MWEEKTVRNTIHKYFLMVSITIRELNLTTFNSWYAAGIKLSDGKIHGQYHVVLEREKEIRSYLEPW